MTNNNKAMVDLPFFELCNQAPAASSALCAMTTKEEGDDRFIYYLTTSAFYRYDTIADTWQQLANPLYAPVTILALKYTKLRGYHGRIISATSNTVTIPGLRGPTLDGQTIKILFGVGQGQERLMTYTGETVHDAGVITATAVTSLSDSVKKWRINQWAGYLVGITFGTDATQYKKIIYNDTTTLYIADVNLIPHDPWNNISFVASSPYALPVTTAGSQAHYQIMSSTYSVPSWTVTPNYTSFFTTITGGIYMITSTAAAPFNTLYYYDIIHDSWQQKTSPQSIILAALGTDVALERTGKIGTSYATKIGTISATNRTLIDSGQNFTAGFLDNYRILITAGTGIGQSRRIVASKGTTLTIARNWDTNPSSDSTYEVWPDFNRLYIAGAAAAAMYAYEPDADFWMQGQHFDDGIIAPAGITATMNGWNPIAITSGVKIASGIISISSTPSNGGSNYVVGDILTCSVGGTGAQVIVTSISSGGFITGLELFHSGSVTGYATGATQAITGGSGTGCTINITAVGGTALITTATAHFYRTGEAITFAGCNAPGWNTAYTILASSSTTVFHVATAEATMVATAAQSVTTLIDPTKNWIPGEHIGRLVHLMVSGFSPTSQIRWITANTATSLTVATWTAGVLGSKYVIYDAKVFGCDDQRKETGMQAYGYATGGTTTTLVDSSKNWIPNQWIGYLFKIEAGTGYGSGRISITASSSNSITFTTQTFSPDATTKYEIADTWGLATAGGTTTPITETTTKNWVVNQWAGKRFRITGGTSLGQETACTSNTNNAITSAALTTTDATSTYAILSIPVRGAGIQLLWTWGASDSNKKGRFIYCPRGSGSNTFDIYNISTGKWIFGYFISPQNELFTTGSSYCYDGVDTIYLSRTVAAYPIRIFKYNINTNILYAVATTTILQSTTHVGNLMEIIDSPSDGFSYIYCLQTTGTVLCRALLF